MICLTEVFVCDADREIMLHSSETARCDAYSGEPIIADEDVDMGEYNACDLADFEQNAPLLDEANQLISILTTIIKKLRAKHAL